MIEHNVDRPRERERLNLTLRFGFAIVALIQCINAANQPVSGQPTQWKQSIERPKRGWDYDGKRILGHVGYDICLWDATTGKLLHKMKGHKERIQAVQFSPDGKHALSSSWISSGGMVMLQSRDTRTILWNLATGREMNMFKGQVAGEFSPDGSRFVTFSKLPDKLDASYGEATLPSTGEVRKRGPATPFDAVVVWDTFTGRQLAKAKIDENTVLPYWDSLHFSPDGRRFVHLVCGAFLPYNSSGGRLYNTSDGREIGRIARGDVKHGGHRYISNGTLAAFDSERARLIDFKSGRVVQNIEHDLKTNWGSVWTHDGSKVVAIQYVVGAIKILDIKSGKTTTGAKSGAYPSRAIISPDNYRLAIEWGGASGENGFIEPELGIYDVNTGKEIARIQLAKSGHIVGFSPDSKTLLVGGSKFVTYNSENGKEIHTLNLLDEVD